jgi:hypothetical protein
MYEMEKARQPKPAGYILQSDWNDHDADVQRNLLTE